MRTPIVKLGSVRSARAAAEEKRGAMPLIKSEFGHSIGTITLDNPAKRNALCDTLVGDIIAALAGFAREKARAVVLRAAQGVKVWSSGHDVDELPMGRRDPLGWDDPLRHLVRQVETFPAPVIAMVEGGVWGACARWCWLAT